MKLTTAKRKSLPKSSFGEPGKRAYPMPDKAHAANAKARATQAVNAGRMSPSTKAKIDAKANRKLGEGRGGTHEPEGHSQHFARGKTPTHEVSTADHFHKL